MMMGFGFGGFGLILMVLFWVLVIGLAVWLVSRIFPQGAGYRSTHPGNRSGGVSSADEILKQRYARGEISKAEYEEMCEELRR